MIFPSERAQPDYFEENANLKKAAGDQRKVHFIVDSVLSEIVLLNIKEPSEWTPNIPSQSETSRS